jgi:hypothetical protein
LIRNRRRRITSCPAIVELLGQTSARTSRS